MEQLQQPPIVAYSLLLAHIVIDPEPTIKLCFILWLFS